MFDFINHMNQSELQSVISSIIGDFQWSGFEHAVSQSFEYRQNTEMVDIISNERYEKAFHHPLIGKIGLFPSRVSSAIQNDGEVTSIAFPASKKVNDDEVVLSLFPLEKVCKQSGNGLRVPISFYQFPSKKQVVAAPQKSCRTLDSAEEQQSDRSLDKGFEIIEQRRNHKESATVSAAFKYAKITKQKSNSTEKTCQQTKYKGKILIQASVGASIREVFDIDKSNHVLGKLQQGDVRYFLKKKELLPPLENSEDYDDDCVPVMRYKIVLEEGDYSSSEFAEKDGTGRLVGWISDRSRLMYEPYKILKEV